MKSSTGPEVILTIDPNPEGTKPGFTTDRKPATPKQPPAARSSIAVGMDATLKRRSLRYSKSNSRFPPQLYPIDASVLEEGRASGYGGDSPYRSPRAPQVTQKTPLMASPGPAGGDNAVDDQGYKNVTQDLSKENNGGRRTKALVEWVVFGILLGCLIASLTVKTLQKSVIWSLQLWEWCLLMMIIFSGMFVTRWIMHLIVFLIERNFMLRKNVLYFVHGLKHSVQFFVWLGLVLFTWVLLFFNQDVHRSPLCKTVLRYVTWTLVSILIGSFMWFLKTLFLKILASKFHVKTFFDRIQVSIFHHYVLQTLSGPPLIEEAEKVGREPSTGRFSFTNYTKIGGKENKQVIDMSKIHRMKREKVTAWTMKVLIDAVMNTGLSTISDELDESMKGGIEGEEDSNSTDRQAMQAASRIFKNVSRDDDNYITCDELRKFMIKEEVYQILPLFEGAMDTGKIDKQTWMNWVVKVYQGRKALAHALTDMKTAVRQLNKVLTGILVVVTVVIWLLLTEIASTKVLIVLSGQLLALGFIFKSTCKTIFESIVFVFIIHPFDVGDRCVIDGIPLLVEEMNILSTVFLKLNFEKVYYPNSILARKPISNYLRSPEMGDAVNFTIDFTTPLGKIGALKERIKKYILEKPQYWYENHGIVVNEIENINQIKMSLYVTHTINFQDFAEKNKRRTELLLELKKIFEELNIRYSLLPQPIHLLDKLDTEAGVEGKTMEDQ